MLLLLLILIFSHTGTFTTWETFNALSLGSQWSEAPSIGLSPDSGSLPIIKIAARSSLAFLSPVHRYDRRPSSSSRRYSELLATGLVGEPTEEEWRRKDLSACILEADPECLPKRGKVLGQIVCLYFFLQKVGDLPVAYLCGQERFCREVGSREALARAKTNVEQAYPVVGVLEQLDASLRVLEARLPRFFRGVRDLYYGKLKGVLGKRY